MPKSYRFLSFFLMVVFATSLVSYVWSAESERYGTRTAPGLLPAAIANPVDVAVEDTLRYGETLSELLARAQLATDEAEALLGQLEEHQDPRRMKPGAVVAFHRSFEDGAVRRMEFQLDADRRLSLLRTEDSWVGEIEEVEVQSDTVVMAGVVESSLYNALLGDESSEVSSAERIRVVDLLADQIFAWQIDFSRDLRRGDKFRILYERLVRPDGTARTGRVLSVQFSINNRDYEAYAYAPGGVTEDYFDAKGESLRRAFLRAPLQYRRISSAFSRSRFHPILQVSRAHNGIDYAAASGTPVYAVGDGVIQRAGNGGGYGNVVDLTHNRNYASRYAHLRGFAAGIRAGVRVKQGQLIGYVGATGQATGPHLHYEFHANGRPIDPNSLSDVTGDPVPQSYTAQFFALVQTYVHSLDRESAPVLAAATGVLRAAPISD